MKDQDEEFIKAREKIKKFMKLHTLPIGSYLKRKLGGYKTANGTNAPLTSQECKDLDNALKTTQNELQNLINQLKQTEQ